MSAYSDEMDPVLPRSGDSAEPDLIGTPRSGLRTSLFPSKTTYHWLYMADHTEVMERLNEGNHQVPAEKMESIYVRGYVLQARATFYWWLIAFVIVLVIVLVYIGVINGISVQSQVGMIVMCAIFGSITAATAIYAFGHTRRSMPWAPETYPERAGKLAWDNLVENYHREFPDKSMLAKKQGWWNRTDIF
jgi:hypothetical protein